MASTLDTGAATSPSVCGSVSVPYLAEMKSGFAIDPNITMGELLQRFPGAQRAMFRKYHIGGCSSCGFSHEETLAGVCARNENVDVQEAINVILQNDAAERAMQMEPVELRARREAGDAISLLDVRTREEFEAVHLPGAQHFTQELMQQIMAEWPRDRLLVIYDHDGARSLDAAAYFQGHGFHEVKSLRGGIDAYSAEVDPSLPRYALETA